MPDKEEEKTGPQNMDDDSDGEEIEMTYEELLIYAARLGDIDDVQFCIDEKVDLISTVDGSGNTALRKYFSIYAKEFTQLFYFIDMACANGHMEVATLLIKHGANVNAVNKSKNTPMRKLNGLPLMLNTYRLGRFEWKG